MSTNQLYSCPICKNKDPRFIGYKNNVPYCRRCISFNGTKVNKNYLVDKNVDSKVFLKYPLTEKQKEISSLILTNYINRKNILVYAVCGAGKTELVFEVMQYALKNKKHVGFAVPRKDVVEELAQRLRATFLNNSVIAVCGGHTILLEADIICMTTHQLFRYESYFDLLIMDEIDAFPYKDNPSLIAMFKRSVRGNYVLMSATPSKSVLNETKRENNVILKLFVRHHGVAIPVPKIEVCSHLYSIYFIIKKIKEFIRDNKPVLVFVPTISDCESLFFLIKKIVKKGGYVHSKLANRSGIIDEFRVGSFKYLITTAVLERGVTIKNLQVIIYKADHKIYNSASLVQISGRVGRVKGFSDGEVIFVGERKTNEMEDAINIIQEANTHL